MDNLKEQTPITPESVLATVEAILAKSAAEFDRQLKQSREDFDRRSAEFDRARQKSNEDFDRRSAEFDRSRQKSNEEFERKCEEFDRGRLRSNEEFERKREEYERKREEFDRERQRSNEEFERKREEYERKREEYDRERQRSNEDFDRRMKKLSEQIGGLSNNHGLFAEEYFINAFKHGKKTFFGEKFDLCRKNVPGFRYEDEYDIVLLNGQSVGIVEVKYRVHDKDISNVIRKVKSFKINYPEYHNHRFYLGLASLVFADQVEGACIDNGIAVIKQVGDTVVINDGHLKAFS